MPELTPGAIFLVILCAVPLQVYLSPSATSDIKYHLQRFTDTCIEIANKVGIRLPGLELRDPKKYGLKSSGGGGEGGDDTIADASDKDGNFGLSLERRERPPHLQFRVGQVVRHKKLKYKGVIIGWDAVAKAPPNWIAKAHGEHKDWALKPNYAVLIDTRDRLFPQLGYVVEENMELASKDELYHIRVIHPLVSTYFEGYNEHQHKYRLRPFLQKVYPDD